MTELPHGATLAFAFAGVLALVFFAIAGVVVFATRGEPDAPPAYPLEIGAEFWYLGARLRVCGYGRMNYDLPPTPGLMCRYVDARGEIQEIFLDMAEVENLKK